jgi:hypothetical protein
MMHAADRSPCSPAACLAWLVEDKSVKPNIPMFDTFSRRTKRKKLPVKVKRFTSKEPT